MKAKQRGVGYSGPDSTRPTQTQESDLSNLGGTAPGGLTAFMGAASQWANSNAAARANFPTGSNAAPIRTAKMMHVGLADEAPDGSGNVPIHPGIMPGKFRTASDANPRSPDGKMIVNYSPSETGGHPLSANGKHRGQSPEIPTQTRGAYRN